MKEPLLSIRNLSVDFHTEAGVVRAVDDLSFDIARGQTVGLVGESGSGKSVTALSIMGLLPTPPARIAAGSLRFAGDELLGLRDAAMRRIRGKRIGMIFQEPMTSLNPVIRVGNQVTEVLRLHLKSSRSQARRRAVELFDQVGLPEPARTVRRYPHELSGGQKQRVMIAMAMACEPDLLICDEPTTALDVTIQKQVLALMQSLQSGAGMSMLFITHDLAVIADLADEVVVMRRAQAVEQAPCAQLFSRPQHPYTQGLLACRPRLRDNPRRLPTIADFMTAAGQPRVPPRVQTEVDKKTDKSARPVLLDVRDLRTRFVTRRGLFGRGLQAVDAVDGVSFQVRRGETLGLVGESGCGKTTLGRTLLRLVPALSGAVHYDGVDVMAQDAVGLRALRARMQMIFQDPYSSLNPRMTVAEMLTEPMRLHGLAASRQAALADAEVLLHKVGLDAAHLHRYAHEFSGGQRQRIGIARALAVQPEFIVCDESVSALDVSVQAQILNLLRDLQDEFKLTYLFISHDLSVVNFIADRVGVMRRGRIIELDTAQQIYDNPRHDYTRQLLAAVPRGVPENLLLE